MDEDDINVSTQTSNIDENDESNITSTTEDIIESLTNVPCDPSACNPPTEYEFCQPLPAEQALSEKDSEPFTAKPTESEITRDSLETLKEIPVDDKTEVSVTDRITENEKINKTATEAKTELSSVVTESNALLGEQASNISTTETVSDGTQTDSLLVIEGTESKNQAETLAEQVDSEVVDKEKPEASTESDSGSTGSGLTAIAS